MRMSSRPECIQEVGLRRVWASYRTAMLCTGAREKLRGIVLLQVAVDISCSVVVQETLFLFFLSSLVLVVAVVAWCARNTI